MGTVHICLGQKFQLFQPVPVGPDKKFQKNMFLRCLANNSSDRFKWQLKQKNPVIFSHSAVHHPRLFLYILFQYLLSKCNTCCFFNDIPGKIIFSHFSHAKQITVGFKTLKSFSNLDDSVILTGTKALIPSNRTY